MLLRVSPFLTLWYLAAAGLDGEAGDLFVLAVWTGALPLTDDASSELPPASGLQMASIRPGAASVPRRWFHFLNLSTGTSKSSAMEYRSEERRVGKEGRSRGSP